MSQDKKSSFEKAKQFFLDTNHERDLQRYQSELMIPDFQIPELAGKKILNIGGGRSPLVRELNQRGLKGYSITNVEPYIGLIRPDDNQHVLIESDFLETDFNNEFDVALALYSIPYYAKTPEQVLKTYQKAITALAPGGILKLYPAFDFEYNYTANIDITKKFIKYFNDNFPKKMICLNRWRGVEFTAPDSPVDKDILNRFLAQNINIID